MAILDYYSATVQHRSEMEVLQYASKWVPSWVEGRGGHGYKKAWCAEGFRVFYDGQGGMGVYFQVSGEGMAKISSAEDFESWGATLLSLREFGFSEGRLDMAFDDREGVVDVREVIRKRRNGEFTSVWRALSIKEGALGQKETQLSVYMGSAESDTSVNIYDKRLEQLVRGNPDPGPWTRVELRYRHKAAVQIVSWIIEHPDLEGAVGFLRTGLEFREPTDDTHTDRWPISPFWEAFCNNSAKYKVSLPKPVRELSQHVKRFTLQHSATLACLVLCMCGGHFRGKWLDDLLYTGWGRMNVQQVSLVRKTLGLPANSGLLPIHGGKRRNE